MKKSEKIKQSIKNRPYRVSVSVDEKTFLDLKEMSLMTGFSISELVYFQLQFRKIFFINPYVAKLQHHLFNVINDYYQKARNCGDCQRICDDIKIAVTELRSLFPSLTIDDVEVAPKLILTKERGKKQKKGNECRGKFIISLKGKSGVEKS